MRSLYKFISWILAHAGLALICFILYKYILLDVFKIDLSYLHWFSIMVISSCIFPEGRILKANNQNQETDKLDTFIQSIINKKK